MSKTDERRVGNREEKAGKSEEEQSDERRDYT